MKLIVNKKNRIAKMRAHTATHLLHAELTKIIENTKQAGSLVDDDYIRFDFNTNKPLTFKQIENIEKNINQLIFDDIKIEIQEMNIDEAMKIWAKAFFEDKYGSIVRVVKIWGNISTELCWWTHVNSTSHIWAFKIIWQEAVASWIKRIIAITWPKVWEELIRKTEYLNQIANSIDSSEKQIIEKLNKIIKEKQDINQKLESIQDKLISNELKELHSSTNYKLDNIEAIKIDWDKFKWINFKEIINKAKEIFDDSFLIYNEEWNFAIKHTQAKKLYQQKWLKWWWKDDFIQWRDPKILKLIIKK